MPTFNSGSETYDNEEIKLPEVQHQRKTRVNVPRPHRSNPSLEHQTQATQSRNHLFHEILHRFRSEVLSKKNTDEATNATSKLALEDTIMTDTKTKLTEKGYIELPSLLEDTPEPQRIIDRPYYNDHFHREGFVAWWDNKTGKGMIIDYRNNSEHKIELKDIDKNYGALIPGSMVEYEYNDEGINKRFSNFWVVSGCEHVLSVGPSPRYFLLV